MYGDDTRYEEVIDKINTYFKSLKAFPVKAKGTEIFPGGVWLRFHENENLQAIHRYLMEFLEREYGVEPHMFDMDYRYHVSLLTGNDIDTAELFLATLQHFELSQELVANTLIIGTSQTGRADDYHIIQKIKI